MENSAYGDTVVMDAARRREMEMDLIEIEKVMAAATRLQMAMDMREAARRKMGDTEADKRWMKMVRRGREVANAAERRRTEEEEAMGRLEKVTRMIRQMDVAEKKRRRRNQKKRERRNRKNQAGDLVEQKVLVRGLKVVNVGSTIRGEQAKCELFIADLVKGKSSKPPYPGGPLWGDEGSSTTVFSGTNVYVLGGRLPDQEDIDSHDSKRGRLHVGGSCLDLSDMSGGWKAIPRYENLEIEPNCVAFKDKLYLFGKRVDVGPFGEIYDPSVGCWKPMSPPPGDVDLGKKVSHPSLVDIANDRIIVHIPVTGSIYAYYPDQGTWECLVEKQWFWKHLVTLVDGLIIFFTPSLDTPFRVYDLKNKEWMGVTSPPPTHFHGDVFETEIESFFAVEGNQVCLATWVSDDDKPDNTHLVFVRFSVKRTSPKDVLINPLKLQTIDINFSCLVPDFTPI